MSVFISHSTTDDSVASFVGISLLFKGVGSYSDHFDQAATSAGSITDFLVRKINDCTHLLAVITPTTIKSWWVPFEIGVARQGNRRITTFNRHGLILPEYLAEWPVLTSFTEFDVFAETYLADRHRMNIALEEKHASVTTQALSSPDPFHHQLKTRLGQS